MLIKCWVDVNFIVINIKIINIVINMSSVSSYMRHKTLK